LTQSSWKIRLGAEAEKDFARILIYTKDTFGPEQADIYKQLLLDSLTTLGEGPNILGSAARDEILPNLRTLHIARRGRRGRHFIMYRAGQGDIIDVIRILHDAMDLARHIPPDLD
jgi:toxin ParE1/3/4